MKIKTTIAYYECEPVAYDVEIEECHFCKKPHFDVRENGITESVQVFCRFCGARGPIGKTVQDAVTKWNEVKIDNPSRADGEKK